MINNRGRADLLALPGLIVMAETPLLELRGITKRFGNLVANDHIDLDVAHGEVHALLGENGAGKSTLMNVLYGLYTPDAGEILFEGKPLHLRSPRDAIQVGIGMVHQHFMLIPVMTVTENIVLAEEPRKGVLMDYGKARETVRDISERYGLAVRPDDKIEDIGVAQQQRVEILKALYRKARILILDEPTAVLTPQEAGELFAVVKSLREQGTSIIFISHKLGEVLEIADRITVLRRGKAVATEPAKGATEQGLAEQMVGRSVLLRVEKKPATPTDPLLTVRDLHVNDTRGLEAVRGLSMEVRSGEIVGIAGVDGNGQTELVEALTGLVSADVGSDRDRRQGRGRRRRRGQLRGRHGPHPGGPPALRPGARLHAFGEPGAARVPLAAGVDRRVPLAPADGTPRTHAAGGVRRPRR